jgi:(1->4)-alpha-D-glucan 1-alpha-D-glucosylmutase
MVAYRRPVATYRVQLHAGFGFRAVAGVIAYLHDLGISDLYCSPILKARPGSMHGYDIVDPTALNPELGEDRDVESLVEELRSRDMGLLLDIVPNHLAISPDNPAWMDVLKRGRESTYARWFDIHWEDSGGRLVLPLLGASLDEVIAAGEISVEMSGGEPAVRYHEWTFPLSDETRSEAHPGIGGDALKNLLEGQHYALCDWKTALERLTYRRFFDITHLIGVRVEDPAVFDATHERILDLVRHERITGLRIDHIDGLADPQAYLERLQQAVGAPDRFYIIVEKILEADEPLHECWPVSGTTGYEFLNALNAIFVDRRGLAA